MGSGSSALAASSEKYKPEQEQQDAAQPSKPSRRRSNSAILLTDDMDVTVQGGRGACQRKLKDVKEKLLAAGLKIEEVESALSALAAEKAAAINGKGSEVSGKDAMSTTDREAGLVDVAEILEAVEGQRGSAPGTIPTQAHNYGKSSFSTWIERCESLLEEEDEANYLVKKQLATQVRAYLANCAALEDQDALSMRQAAHAYLGDESESDSEDEDEPALAVRRFVSCRTVHSIKHEDKFERSEGLGMTAPELFEKLLARKSRMPTSKKYVHKLLDRFAEKWEEKYKSSTLLKVSVPKNGKMIVVGDTHGQLEDVLTIFLRHGPPSSKTRYLFNGDIADRGPNAVDIFCLLFAYFIEDPDCIIINRGNHEDSTMNMLSADEGGGFHDEVLKKYTGGIFMKFERIYKMLPLAIVVQDEVFVVHGGLSRNAKSNLNLPFIASIDAKAVCCPSASPQLSLKEHVFSDLVWSDPHEQLGWVPNPRGAGIKWGPDLTNAFLKRTGLKWIIRSHQVPEGRRGWMEHHLGLVYTIFSASNYCGTTQNKGGVAILEFSPSYLAGLFTKGKLVVSFEEHYAPALDQGRLYEISQLPDMKARRAALEEAGAARATEDHMEVGQRQERAILAKMSGRVVEHRPELWQSFQEEDTGRSGKVSFKTWCELMTATCGENFPWALAAELWCLADDEAVDYRDFLNRFQIGVSQEKWLSWKTLLMKDVWEALHCMDSDLKDMLKLFDPEATGKVKVQDFLKVLSELKVTGEEGPAKLLLTTAQLQALTRGLFPSKSESNSEELDIAEFFERFTVIYRQAKSLSGVDLLAEWRPTLAMLGQLILRHDRNSQILRMPSVKSVKSSVSKKAENRPSIAAMAKALQRQYEEGDASGDGRLQLEELVEMLQSLPGIEQVLHKGQPITEKDLTELAEALADMSGTRNGQVNFITFMEAFMVERVESAELIEAEASVAEHILSFLYRHRHAVCCGCTAADPNLTGRVSTNAFAEVLRGIDVSLARDRRNLTDVQIDGLAESLSEDDDAFSYIQFLQALVVQDAVKISRMKSHPKSTAAHQSPRD